jgi:hypothetical protein
LTVDSPDDLRTLAEYAESVGREELATSMRLETRFTTRLQTLSGMTTVRGSC